MLQTRIKRRPLHIQLAFNQTSKLFLLSSFTFQGYQLIFVLDHFMRLEQKNFFQLIKIDRRQRKAKKMSEENTQQQ